MAIREVVTRGFGNGTFSTTIAFVTRRGYLSAIPIFSARLPDRTYEERARDQLVKDSLNPFSAYGNVPPARKKIIVPN